VGSALFKQGDLNRNQSIFKQRDVCASPFTLKSMLIWQKKNYGNSNISPPKYIIFKKNPLKEIKILQDVITL
jgi:hypothetical protein